MPSILGAIMLQTFYYAVAMLFGIIILAFLQKGFFWKYVKVRLSFGRLILVKIRSTIRDYFSVGEMEEGFIVFKIKKEKYRISISPEDKPFYRCLAANWIDISEENWGICKTNYATVSGFDPKKYSDLLTRALMRPSVTSNQEKIILVLLIFTMVLVIAAIYMGYKNGQSLDALKGVPDLIRGVKATVIGGSAV